VFFGGLSLLFTSVSPGSDYSLQNGIYMKINYFNADHVHALIDLPTSKSIEDVKVFVKKYGLEWRDD